MTQEDDRCNILTIQKDLMDAILDYQIRYGSGTVGWNVNVQFIEVKGEPVMGK